MIINSLYALFCSLGFGILFNIHGKKLFFAAFGGGIGWYFYLLSDKYTHSIVFSLFIASLVISIYSEIIARIFKAPVTIFLVAALLPLVPGAGMYYTMYQSIIGNATKSLSLGIETIFSAGAIAIATMLVSSITKVILAIKKKFTS
ncbi:membrane protein [Clostridium novyi A str. 4552]|uniref:Membrane protein n=1 Tax=Clostridium novyi A str. 4552 TaxID=1444289 RepID=A0A0A0I6G6_CLONO|nr:MULTISPECIES: threonine/serine exporter family protein [Clostridium]EDS76734.1 membrane spanning protein [Clostridium botulinum C str. Eklund]KEH98138.1 membrane protein [Clostridium botulinum C/D str. BKT12695]KGM97029.1 membrane protein [Clostridium novyi A str. 4552]NEZ48396.1 threonine/serine exporter [Clostridium botulinum]